jgi:hypothetical protein
LTINTTLPARENVRVRIVTRRRFGPVVPIHPREDLNCVTLARFGPDPVEPEELPTEEPRPEPEVEPEVEPEPSPGDGPVLCPDDDPAAVGAAVPWTAADVVATAAVPEETAVEVEGSVVVGAVATVVGLGAEGTGTGSTWVATVVTVVTVGSVGMGTPSARAWPARTLAPMSTITAAAAFILGQLGSGKKGCGLDLIRKNV